LLSFLYAPVAAAGVASIGAAGGVALTGRGSLTRYLIPLSGGFLILVAVAFLMPELANGIGWPLTIGLAALGYGVLMAVDRLAFSVCPSCDHKGHSLDVRLEGFAAPLLAAVAIHAFVDGWGLVAVRVATPGAGRSLALAILLHKIPEGLTLGAVTRASFERAGVALAWCVAVEMATVAGGGAGLWLTPAAWVSYPLAVAAGTFLFLGGGALGVRVPGRLAR
jgi:zinc transporter ZupT